MSSSGFLSLGLLESVKKIIPAFCTPYFAGNFAAHLAKRHFQTRSGKNLSNLVVKFPKAFKGSFNSIIFLTSYNSQPYRTPYARHHPRTKYNYCLHIPA